MLKEIMLKETIRLLYTYNVVFERHLNEVKYNNC